MKTSTAAGNRPPSPEALRKQAQVWLTTLVSGDVKPWDAEAFKRWLHASPAHKDAFYEVKRQWDELKPGVSEMLRANPQAAAFHDRTLRVPMRGRRAFLGAAVGTAAVAAVAGIAVFHPPASLWPAPGEWGADFRTATGEQRTVTLADRVSITLNTQTSIRRQRTEDATTGIDLLAGEAAIDLLPNGKPFSVSAGAGQSVADSGRFEVRYLAGKVCVSCIEGSVRVVHPGGVRVLQAHQQAVYDASSLSGVANIDPLEVSAWRRGELVFNQTRLAGVIDEINRYRTGEVILVNSSVRNKPVSGRFVIAWLDAALMQLQHTFDLDARSLPGGVVVLS